MTMEIILPIAFGVFALVLTLASAWNWRGGKYLCDLCRFNNDKDCRKADRPRAVICTAYEKRKQQTRI